MQCRQRFRHVVDPVVFILNRLVFNLGLTFAKPSTVWTPQQNEQNTVIFVIGRAPISQKFIWFIEIPSMGE